jgi:tetratricopeptide (TPR) repeat protein
MEQGSRISTQKVSLTVLLQVNSSQYKASLQKQYLLLLLIYPNAKESKDAETHMWMQTSYALISIYKTRIAALEHALHEAGTQRQHPRTQRPGPVEYRKLMQRFKQFLSTEEKFWTHLVVRIQRQFSLSEARSALSTLSIVTDTEPAVDDPDAEKHDHFRFPPESVENAPSQSSTPTQRSSRRATLSKALVVLGDLARYREQYNEGGARSRGGPERGGRNARGRGSQADLPRAKTYDKARACYECARDLMPDDGNASHQLAILASYQKDTFESLVQYYKALCVRSAYDPAAENMGNVLSKFLEAWKRRRKSRPGPPPPEDPNRPKTNSPSFKDNVILLHALWRLDVEE